MYNMVATIRLVDNTALALTYILNRQTNTHITVIYLITVDYELEVSKYNIHAMVDATEGWGGSMNPKRVVG